MLNSSQPCIFDKTIEFFFKGGLCQEFESHLSTHNLKKQITELAVVHFFVLQSRHSIFAARRNGATHGLKSFWASTMKRALASKRTWIRPLRSTLPRTSSTVPREPVRADPTSNSEAAPAACLRVDCDRLIIVLAIPGMDDVSSSNSIHATFWTSTGAQAVRALYESLRSTGKPLRNRHRH